MAEHLLLVGTMGAGKSTVGRLVADRLGWVHVDTDHEVERRAGMSVSEVFARRGEPAFRRLESDVLAAVLRRPGPSVVSVGGGAVLDPDNRAALAAGGTVVWLRARPDTLADRVGTGGDRPLLGGDVAGAGPALVRIDGERRPLYQAVADEVIDVDDLEPDAVAGLVLAALGTPSERRP